MKTSLKQLLRLLPLILVTVLALGTVVGCQASPATTPTAASTASSTAAATTAATTTATVQATTSTTSAPTTSVTTDASMPSRLTGPFTDADLALTIEGKSYALLSDASGLLKALGDDCQVSEAESCVYEGMDKTFDYGFIQIFTIPNGDVDMIDGIYLLDDRYETARGIKVGAAMSDVIDAYGEKEDNGGLIYNKSGDPENLGDPNLTFVIENDKVTAISFYSGSNVQGAGNGG